MASLFHLIFEFVRISILALVYGYLIWVIATKFFKKNGFRKRYLVPIIFVGLIIFRFSYWGNNGFGDFGRVPLSSEYEVTMIDFSYASINKDSARQQTVLMSGIERLYMENGILFGQAASGFIIFNYNTKNLKKELSEQQFRDNNGVVRKLSSLSVFHGNYWGWKILFL